MVELLPGPGGAFEFYDRAHLNPIGWFDSVQEARAYGYRAIPEAGWPDLVIGSEGPDGRMVPVPFIEEVGPSDAAPWNQCDEVRVHIEGVSSASADEHQA